jgi:hypothetical protein
MWQLHRNQMLRHRWPSIQIKDYTGTESWQPCFVLWPRRSLSGGWLWLTRAYTRRVWQYTGFIDEPFQEYGNIFDVIKHG